MDLEPPLEPSLLERVKSGELVGRKALEALAATGEYVFHGSKFADITEFEPRQAINNQQPDGEPAVFATELIDVAIFAAVIKGSAGSSAWDINGIEPEKSKFYATEAAINQARIATEPGHVYVFPAFAFQTYRGSEMVSYRIATPLLDVPVRYEDFELGVSDFSEYRPRNQAT